MTWFEIFLKHKPIVYEKGSLAFQLLENPFLFVTFLLIAVVGSIFLYRMVAVNGFSWGMVALRAMTFVILLFILMRPVMIISTVLPQESYLAVVVDNSESMSIEDKMGNTRAQLLIQELEATGFFQRLEEKFRVRIYRFDQEAERIDALDRLSFTGTRTRIESVMDLIYQELGTVPLSGIVLITDGVDNASETLVESLGRIQARGIPIYTVGVGDSAVEGDVQLIRAVTPRSILNDSTAIAEISYRSEGLAGKKAILHVRENGVLLKSEEITLSGDGEIDQLSIDLPVTSEGARVFSFSIQTMGDRIPQNNQLSSLIEVENDRPKVLYVEGEPRWEYRYIRRAVEDDPNLQLVTLLRTSPNKFYRQGIDEEHMLADGFPTSKEELFKYKGLILGSIESTFFTQEQLEMIVDFVSHRGGGFLMIGGRNSFSEGRYQNTPIADVLPVRLPVDGANFLVENVMLQISDYGRTHPLMQLSPAEGESVGHWDDLPPLTEFNRVIAAKEGAIVLANGQSERSGRDEPVLLAYQRYGRGRAMAFTTSSSWRWQMEMHHEDMTHELFWRQILRWLASASPDSVMARSGNDSYVPGEVIQLFADVSDESFERMNNADVFGKVINPDGETQPVSFEWNGVEDGTYQAEILGGSPGIYTLEIEASYQDDQIGNHESTFQVRDRSVEFYNAALDSRFLRNLALESEGRYYPLSNINNLPDDAVHVDGDLSITEERELWDLPLLFILLSMTLIGEWTWRRQRGLA